MARNTILLVDDEEGVLKAIARTLADDGYHLLTARNGEEGLVRLRQHDIDLVISDQKMPGMAGIDFLKTVQRGYPDVLTIMLTAHADIDVSIQAINDAGVYKFILKPWNSADFKLTVKRALELRQLTIEKQLLSQRVQRQEAVLKRLEANHPGITNVERGEDGSIVVEP